MFFRADGAAQRLSEFVLMDGLSLCEVESCERLLLPVSLLSRCLADFFFAPAQSEFSEAFRAFRKGLFVGRGNFISCDAEVDACNTVLMFGFYFSF